MASNKIIVRKSGKFKQAGGTDSVDANTSLIKNVVDPVDPQDADTKNARDAAISLAIAGVIPALRLSAITNGVLPNSPTYLNGVSGVGATLTSGSSAVLVVDGYAPTVLNERVGVKDQASALQNGVYYVSQLGVAGVLPWVLTRSLDYDQPTEINSAGALEAVNGTQNKDTSWLLDSTVTIVGTDALNYVSFTIKPSTIITTSTTAAGELAGTYPNPTILNSAVIAKLITGYISGQGVVAATDSILQALQKINGNGIAQLASYTTLMKTMYNIAAGITANTYFMMNGAFQTSNALTTSGNVISSNPALIYIAAADYPSVNGLTPKLRIRAGVFTNHAAPGQTFTFGLYPMTAPASSGTGSLRSWTIGTVVSGSNGASQASPAADTNFNLVGSDFALPADGFYSVCVLLGGTTAASSFTECIADLQITYK